MSEPDIHRMPELQGNVIGVTTLIGYEYGQWVVYLEIAFRNAIRRHRIHAYSTEHKAQVAADFIRQEALHNTLFKLEASQ